MPPAQEGRDDSGPVGIQSLPTELLREIFCYYVNLNDSPWRLTLVSRRWCRISLSVQELWSRIIIVDKERLEDTRWNIFGTPRYANGRALVCRHTRDVTAAVQLTGACPLHIAVTCNDIGGDGHSVEALMREIFSPAIAPRIVELSISIHPYVNFDTEHFTPQDGQFGSFSNLAGLEIYLKPRFWLQPLLKAIYTSSSASLRYLRIPRTIPEDQISDITTVCTNLERLDSASALWPYQTMPSTTLPRLHYLRVRCPSQYLGRLHLPLVEHLVIYDVLTFLLQSTESSRPQLPNLLHLQAITHKTKWLEDIIAPKLRVLSISVTENLTLPTYHLISPNAFPLVETFTFETSFKTEEGRCMQQFVFISALQAVPNAVTVKMLTESTAMLYPEPRIEFLDRLGSVGENEILCPQLRDLELVSRTCGGPELDEYEFNMLQRIADNRRKVNKELSRFVFQWTTQASELLTQRFT